MGILKKGDGSKKSRKVAKDKLKKSIAKDPKYGPSHLSLAAIQLYQEEVPKASLKTIEEALDVIPFSQIKERKALKDLKLDAEAMDDNLGHMVQAGTFASPYLT